MTEFITNTCQERLRAALLTVDELTDCFDGRLPSGEAALPFVVITLVGTQGEQTAQAELSGDMSEHWRVDIWCEKSDERLHLDSLVQSALCRADEGLSVEGMGSRTFIDEAAYDTNYDEGVTNVRLRPATRSPASGRAEPGQARRVIRTYELAARPYLEVL